MGRTTASNSKVKNGKAPGLNNVPPDAFKSLTKNNLANLLEHLNLFWHDGVDFEEWHECRVVPVPKSGNLSDPNKWRGVTLIDIGSKCLAVFYAQGYLKSLKRMGLDINSGQPREWDVRTEVLQ